jgi:hypothetical protein
MELPFFLVAHGIELLSGGRADGMSQIYQELLLVSNLFYAILGLFILYQCLKRYFGQTNSMVSLAVLICGTNFLWFAVVQWGMSHIYTFFLVSSLIRLSLSVYEAPRPKTFILIGLTAGMIVLIRPTDFVFLAIPFLWGVSDFKSFSERFWFLIKHRVAVLFAVCCAFLVFVPQLLYWKAASGHFLFYSYGGNQTFHWRHPRIFDGLFSYKNGWLVYSPVMILSLTGILFWKKTKDFLLIFLCVLPVFVYLTYAWYCYNYINGFGSRPMLNMYPLLAFPLAAFIQFIGHRSRILIALFTLTTIFLSTIAYSYSVQQGIGMLWSENSNKTYNQQIMFRYHLRYNDLVCFDNELIQPDPAEIHFSKPVKSENFESLKDDHIHVDSTLKSNVYEIWSGEEYAKFPLEVTYSRTLFADARWIRCEGMFQVNEFAGPYNQPVIVLEIKKDTNFISWHSCRINNKIGYSGGNAAVEKNQLNFERLNRWGKVSFYVPIPSHIPDSALIRMHIWSIGRKFVLMDNLKMELYR